MRFFRMNLIEVWPPLTVDSGSDGPLSPIAAERISRPAGDNKIDQVKRGNKRTGREPKEMKRVIREIASRIYLWASITPSP